MEPREGAAGDPSEAGQLEDESDEDDAPAPYHWYVVPIAQVALCAVVGGWLYQWRSAPATR